MYETDSDCPSCPANQPSEAADPSAVPCLPRGEEHGKTKTQKQPFVYIAPVLQTTLAQTPENESASLEREDKIRCDLCPHACLLKEGQKGFCKVRYNDGERVRATRDGYASSIALDPIEKKPLSRFHPGSQILSVGFYGCNMRCPFCQNHDISMVSDTGDQPGTQLSPKQLIRKAAELRARGNIGICFTYNEPLVHFEWIRECFSLAKAADLETILVTNGCFEEQYIREIAPLTSAWNIDLKCFSQEGYNRLAGDFETVKNTIRIAAEHSHVEVTTLVVPALSDGEEDMEAEAAWLAGVDPKIVLHLTRFFPRYRSEVQEPTPIAKIRKLGEIAARHVQYVELGNI